MSFSGKVYVCFDADSDIHYYRLMKAWKQSDSHSFNFDDSHDLNTLRTWSSEETIKGKLRERLRNSSLFVVLIGENTRYLYKYVRWEIEQALSLDLPIVCVNLNGKRSLDVDKCPPLLKDKLVLHISYNTKILEKALSDWHSQYKINKASGKSGDFSYNPSTYSQLGL